MSLNKILFHPHIIRQVQDMYHEIGYHHETLSDANGDPEKAIDRFRSHLDDLNYFSDTGRSWGDRNSQRYFIPGKVKGFTADTTDDLIEGGKLDNLHILTHLKCWSLNAVEWGLYCGANMAVNVGKKVIATVRT